MPMRGPVKKDKTVATTIAIADDETDLREAVAEYLEGHAFRVLTAADAAAFRALADAQPIDLAILDIAMPGEDGLSLARWFRRTHGGGIIFASASGTAMDRIVGLEIGADDYLAKPYDLRELLARVRSVLRRMDRGAAPVAAAAAPAALAPAAVIGFGPWRLDNAQRRVTGADGGVLALSPAEFDLLEVLAARPNRILTRAQLAEFCGAETEGAEGERRIDVRIARLRRKIEPDDDSPKLIRTVRGEGYVFSPDGG